MAAAIFLDRDGVLIQNQPDYVRNWSDVIIFPQALKALQQISRTDYRIVIVTNQAGIGKRLISPDAAQEINRQLIAEIEMSAGRIDGLYVCPHSPEMGCSCRKPRPGLILQAAKDLNIDLEQSILVGDALTDIQAGHSAGVRRLILVKTGRGMDQLPIVSQTFSNTVEVYEDLQTAVQNLLDGQPVPRLDTHIE